MSDRILVDLALWDDPFTVQAVYEEDVTVISSEPVNDLFDARVREAMECGRADAVRTFGLLLKALGDKYVEIAETRLAEEI